MRILQLQPHLTTAELSNKLGTSKTTQHRSYWQILLSLSFNPNKKASEYALFLGTTTSKIYRVVEAYNKVGATFLDNKAWGGRRLETSIMSFDDEVKIMNDLKIKANEGKILVAKHLKKIVEKKVGKEVSEDYIWDLFKRHNWKKNTSASLSNQMPRLKHPKINKEAQEGFKKSSLKYWHPNE